MTTISKVADEISTVFSSGAVYGGIGYISYSALGFLGARAVQQINPAAFVICSAAAGATTALCFNKRTNILTKIAGVAFLLIAPYKLCEILKSTLSIQTCLIITGLTAAGSFFIQYFQESGEAELDSKDEVAQPPQKKDDDVVPPVPTKVDDVEQPESIDTDTDTVQKLEKKDSNVDLTTPGNADDQKTETKEVDVEPPVKTKDHAPSPLIQKKNSRGHLATPGKADDQKTETKEVDVEPPVKTKDDAESPLIQKKNSSGHLTSPGLPNDQKPKSTPQSGAVEKLGKTKVADARPLLQKKDSVGKQTPPPATVNNKDQKPIQTPVPVAPPTIRGPKLPTATPVAAITKPAGNAPQGKKTPNAPPPPPPPPPPATKSAPEAVVSIKEVKAQNASAGRTGMLNELLNNKPNLRKVPD